MTAQATSAITAKMLAQRLGTVARDLDLDGTAVPMYIRINGERHALTIDNFHVDDDGSLLFALELLLPNPLRPLHAALKERLQWFDGVDFVRMADVESALQDALGVDTNPAWTSVLAERIRQVQVHGYTSEADDDYTDGQLAAAAACYLEEAFCQIESVSARTKMHLIVPEHWPWIPSEWKPSADPRRNLVKALALGLAELERLDRKTPPAAEEPTHG